MRAPLYKGTDFAHALNIAYVKLVDVQAKHFDEGSVAVMVGSETAFSGPDAS